MTTPGRNKASGPRQWKGIGMPNNHTAPGSESAGHAHDRERELGRFFGLDPMTALQQLASVDQDYRRRLKDDPKATLAGLGIDTGDKDVRVIDPDEDDVVVIVLNPANAYAAATWQNEG
jgi:hypothetical protein